MATATLPNLNPRDLYISDEAHARVVDLLATLADLLPMRTAMCPETWAIELLGERMALWPKSIEAEALANA